MQLFGGELDDLHDELIEADSSGDGYVGQEELMIALTRLGFEVSAELVLRLTVALAEEDDTCAVSISSLYEVLSSSLFLLSPLADSYLPS